MKLGPGVTAAALASSRVVAHTVPPGSKDLHRVDGSTQQHKNQNQGYPGTSSVAPALKPSAAGHVPSAGRVHENPYDASNFVPRQRPGFTTDMNRPGEAAKLPKANAVGNPTHPAVRSRNAASGVEQRRQVTVSNPQPDVTVDACPECPPSRAAPQSKVNLLWLGLNIAGLAANTGGLLTIAGIAYAQKKKQGELNAKAARLRLESQRQQQQSAGLQTPALPSRAG